MAAADVPGYPVVLDLRGRRVLVAGGGRVASRRVTGLLEADADVTVVAPRLEPSIAALVAAGRLRAELRAVSPADVDDAWLVHACTDDPAVNAEIAAAAEARRVPCVRADAAQQGTARTPAVARSGGVTVAVSSTAVTEPGDPRRAVAVRDAVSRLLVAGELPLRAVRGRAGAGHVALVGGGPGDPGLLTVRGRALLAAADVVVTDRLAPVALLEELPDEVEIVWAGKRPRGASMPQEEINAVLVDRARAGARVVRLKGGDPFVFGRGAEEAEACVRAGVPFEVVPGVTSAVAVPAYAGIPVTSRGVVQEFSVVSGHLGPADSGSTVDWAALAAGSGTLVLLMAVRALERIAAELVACGRPPETPAAVVSAGTTPAQQVVVADLATIAERAARLPAPAVVVVGDVVRLRETLQWWTP